MRTLVAVLVPLLLGGALAACSALEGLGAYTEAACTGGCDASTGDAGADASGDQAAADTGTPVDATADTTQGDSPVGPAMRPPAATRGPCAAPPAA